MALRITDQFQAVLDEGIEVLTGLPAGTRDADGDYPPDTINGKVEQRLQELAERVKSFGPTIDGSTL